MSKSKTCKVCDYKQLEKDLAYLQVCVQAMGERLDMLEAENVRLRSLWGGTTHTGVPFWVGNQQTEPWGSPKVWSSVSTARDTTTA